MYVEFFFRRERSVENSVESVEFHTQKGLENLNFKLSPQSFPLVENSRGIYRVYTGGFVENFLSCAKPTDNPRAGRQSYSITAAGMKIWGESERKSASSMAKKVGLCYTLK